MNDRAVQDWRARATRLVERLHPATDDADWRAAMTLLAQIGGLIGSRVVAQTALSVRGASGEAVPGLAVRRSALAALAACLSGSPQNP